MYVFRFREFGLKTPIHAPKLEVFRGRIGEEVGRYWPPTNSYLLLGVYTSVSNLVKIDEEMRPWECPQTDRQTHTHTHTHRRKTILLSVPRYMLQLWGRHNWCRTCFSFCFSFFIEVVKHVSMFLFQNLCFYNIAIGFPNIQARDQTLSFGHTGRHTYQTDCSTCITKVSGKMSRSAALYCAHTSMS